LRKQWCIGQITAEFLWRMEQVLNVYEQSYNSRRPVICLDERPCQLLGEVMMPMAMKPNRIQRQDYHYERRGTCVVFMALEPFVGKRFVKVTERKTKRDYSRFMKELSRRYRKAEKIIIVQDNLNTHNPSSFYESFDAQEAFELSQRFEFIYTPKKASWLNMAEIELSALSKQCLDRRIGDMESLTNEVYPWAKQRNRERITVSWQFSKNKARNKFNRFYQTIKN
jgi:hypothetical protein